MYISHRSRRQLAKGLLMSSYIPPVTDFHKETEAALSELQETPVILTQRSPPVPPVAVLVDYSSYNAQLKRIEGLELLLDDYALNQAIDNRNRIRNS